MAGCSAALFDDYILAALVLYGAWLAGRDFRRGQCFLAAAWGVVCGVGYGSIMGQIHRIQTGVPDRAPISAASVAVIKGVLFALSVLALIATLRAKPDTDGDGKVQFAVAQSHFKPSLSADPHHSESSFDV